MALEILALAVALTALACSTVIAVIQMKTRHLAMAPRFEFDTVGHARRNHNGLTVFENPVLTLQNLGPDDYDDVYLCSIACVHGEKQFDAIELFPGEFASEGSIGSLAVGETRRMRFEALSTWRIALDRERSASFVSGHGRLLVVATKGRRKWRFVPHEIPFRDYLASAIVMCPSCQSYSPVSFRAVETFEVDQPVRVARPCGKCGREIGTSFTLKPDSVRREKES